MTDEEQSTQTILSYLQFEVRRGAEVRDFYSQQVYTIDELYVEDGKLIFNVHLNPTD